MGKWNEIVLDQLLLLPDMQQDPARAVPAFLYTQKMGDVAKKAAESARDEYCKYNKVAPIPVVMVDNVHVCPNGPFAAPGAWGCSAGSAPLRARILGPAAILWVVVSTWRSSIMVVS